MDLERLNDPDGAARLAETRLAAETAALRREAAVLALVLVTALALGMAFVAGLYTANAAWSVLGGLAVGLVWLLAVLLLLVPTCLGTRTLVGRDALAFLGLVGSEANAPGAVRERLVRRARRNRHAARWLNACRLAAALAPLVFVLAATYFSAAGWDDDGDGSDDAATSVRI